MSTLPERTAPGEAVTHAPPLRTRCGTVAGYAAHRRNGEPTCTACRAANTERQRQYREGGSDYAPRPQAECGTSAGYSRHLRFDEPACDACRAAQREYMRDYMRAYRARRGIGGRYAKVPLELLIRIARVVDDPGLSKELRAIIPSAPESDT